MRQEFSLQTIQAFTPPEPQVEQELTLEQKVMLANHPAIKQMLEQQLEVERAKQIADNIETYQKFVQEGAEDEAKKLGIKPTFRIFLHNDVSDTKTVRIRDGLVVHIHIDTKASEIFKAEFWDDIRRYLKKVPALTRSCALVVRNYYWEQQKSFAPKWKKVNILDEEVEFDLLSHKHFSISEEIKLVLKHKETGITVILSGAASERDSLEREGWVLLSQKVALFNHLV